VSQNDSAETAETIIINDLQQSLL